MATKRFRELERRVGKLRKRFLPKQFSPTGNYTDRQLDHARGFRLLVHAEIEAYLEDRAQHIASVSIRQYRTDGRPRHVLMNLLSFHLVQTELSKREISDLYLRQSKYCDQTVTNATSSFNHSLANNHGVRELNFLRLVLPLGLDPAKIDPAWLGTLDAFGSKRGETAHKSIKVQQVIDPQDEFNTAQILIRGLEDLDRELSALE